MFGRRKDGVDGGRNDPPEREPAVESRPAPPAAPPRAAEGLRSGIAESSRPAPAAEPRRAPELGNSASRRSQETRPASPENEAKRLIVGNGIVLTGEIRSC